MSRNVIAPTEHRDGDGVTLKHPAFAQVTVFKTSGDHTLYGSDIQHPYSISLRIHHSELQRKYSTDRYRADHRPFAEIRLSMSQWAQMVSSIGDGVGTPATLVFKDGETIPGIAYESRTNEFKRESKETLDGVLNELNTLRADLLAGTSGLSKTKQAAMVDRVTAAMRKVSDSLPFIEETFVEHLEGLKTQAAIEINAMMSDARNAQSAIGGRAPLDLLEHRGEGADERG